MWRSQRGLLLVEAILSAIIVAVGLVFVSRALSSEVNALHVVEESATVFPLADATLRAMNGVVQSGRAPGTKRDGTFDPPNAGYRWIASAQPLETGDAQPRYGMVTLTIRRVRDDAIMTFVRALWPMEFVPTEWFS